MVRVADPRNGSAGRKEDDDIRDNTDDKERRVFERTLAVHRHDLVDEPGNARDSAARVNASEVLPCSLDKPLVDRRRVHT